MKITETNIKKDFTISPVKRSERELVKKVVRRVLSTKNSNNGNVINMVEGCLKHNCLTITQFSTLSGLSISNTHRKTKMLVKGGELVFELDICFPLEDSYGRGLKFIVFDKKTLDLIKGLNGL